MEIEKMNEKKNFEQKEYDVRKELLTVKNENDDIKQKVIKLN